MKTAIAGAGVVAVAAASTIGIARITEKRRIACEVDDLFAAMRDIRPPVVTEADLVHLPKPVQRWLRYSQVISREIPLVVRLKQRGEFRLEGHGWMPFEAEEYYTTDPPGFVWSVVMRMVPLVSITGRDRYIDGAGDIKMRVLSLIPVADNRRGNLNQGALLRYLNETMWFPAGALRSYIAWGEVDANSARATMSYGSVTATATFIFDDAGRLVNMVAERYNDARDRLEIWSTPISAYGEFDGIRIPVEGEGIWKYDTGDFSYIRLRITDVNYNMPERY